MYAFLSQSTTFNNFIGHRIRAVLEGICMTVEIIAPSPRFMERLVDPRRGMKDGILAVVNATHELDHVTDEDLPTALAVVQRGIFKHATGVGTDRSTASPSQTPVDDLEHHAHARLAAQADAMTSVDGRGWVGNLPLIRQGIPPVSPNIVVTYGIPSEDGRRIDGRGDGRRIDGRGDALYQNHITQN